MNEKNDDLALADLTPFTIRGGIPNVMAQLQAGGTVRVAFLGGSITQADGWRGQTLEWLRSWRPEVDFVETAASIGGTGSDFGVFRLGDHALQDQPDLLFVEFAVNDSSSDPDCVVKAMEGIVRQTLRALPNCDIVFVYTISTASLPLLRQKKMTPVASLHEQVAIHYGIPTIHMGFDIARLEDEGELVFTVPPGEEEETEASGKIAFARDGCHPYIGGHRLYTKVVASALEAMAEAGEVGPHELPAPLSPTNWERATILPFSSASEISEFERLEPDAWPEIAWSPEVHPELWRGDQPGARVVVRFRGIGIGIFDVVGPECGQLEVMIDGELVKVLPRFDSHCSYRRTQYAVIVSDLPDKEHEAVFTIHEDEPDKAAIFAERDIKMDNPADYQGRVWFPTAFLIIGEAL